MPPPRGRRAELSQTLPIYPSRSVSFSKVILPSQMRFLPSRGEIGGRLGAQLIFPYWQITERFQKSVSSTYAGNGFCFLFLFVCFSFLGPYPRHMEVPRMGVELQLQLLAYTTGCSHSNAGSQLHLRPTLQLTATWILNPLSEARDQPVSSWTPVGFVSTAP